MSTAPDIAQRTAASSIDVSFADCWITPAAQAAAQRVLASGWVTTGTESQAFESEFATYVGAAQAVTVSSCTAAIELALRSLRLDRGSLVLTSTMTFCGAVHAIEHAGLRPVLVDVDPETGMPTPETVARAVEGCGGGRPPWCVVHWAGDPLDLGPLAAAAGLPADRVVEDAAHAPRHRVAAARDVGTGSRDLLQLLRHQEPARSARAAWSPPTTRTGPPGSAGPGCTACPQDAWRRYLPGGSWRYDVAESGLKANMSDLPGGDRPGPARGARRVAGPRALLAARYDALLAGVPGVRLPHRPDPARRHAWHLYAVQVDGRPLARRRRPGGWPSAGIGTSVHFIPLHRLSYFSATGRSAGRPARRGPAVRPAAVPSPLPAADRRPGRRRVRPCSGRRRSPRSART